MTEHTSGPWEADGLVVKAARGIIAKTILPQKGGTFHAMDNARLIAAAPDLLAACKAFVEAWERCLQLEKTDMALRMAHTAIAKVQGENVLREVKPGNRVDDGDL